MYPTKLLNVICLLAVLNTVEIQAVMTPSHDILQPGQPMVLDRQSAALALSELGQIDTPIERVVEKKANRAKVEHGGKGSESGQVESVTPTHAKLGPSAAEVNADKRKHSD